MGLAVLATCVQAGDGGLPMSSVSPLAGRLCTSIMEVISLIPPDLWRPAGHAW